VGNGAWGFAQNIIQTRKCESTGGRGLGRRGTLSCRVWPTVTRAPIPQRCEPESARRALLWTCCSRRALRRPGRSKGVEPRGATTVRAAAHGEASRDPQRPHAFRKRRQGAAAQWTACSSSPAAICGERSCMLAAPVNAYCLLPRSRKQPRVLQQPFATRTLPQLVGRRPEHGKNHLGGRVFAPQQKAQDVGAPAGLGQQDHVRRRISE